MTRAVGGALVLCGILTPRAALAQSRDLVLPRRVPQTARPESESLPETAEALDAQLRAMDESRALCRALHEEIRAQWRVIPGSEEHEFGLDAVFAQQVVDELWHDWGFPVVNYFHQQAILADLGRISLRAGAAQRPDLQAVVRSGLLEYCRGGGAETCDPKMLSIAFRWADGLEDPEVRTIVESIGDPYGLLKKDPSARRKNGQLERPQGDVEPSDSPDAVIFEEELAAIARLLSEDDGGVAAGASSSARQEARQLLRDLRKWMHHGARDASELRRIATRAARGFGDAQLDDRVLRSLLTAYRQVLQQRSKPLEQAMVKVIDADLVRVGRAKQGQVETQLLWGRAVEFMGPRSSSELQAVLHQRAKAAEDPRLVYVLSRAQEKLKPAEKP